VKSLEELSTASIGDISQVSLLIFERKKKDRLAAVFPEPNEMFSQADANAALFFFDPR